MKIVKYKRLTNGRYKIYLDDLREIILYEEVILEFQLLLKKEIDDDTLLKINSLNMEWEVYYEALKALKSRFRSRKDLGDFLLKKDFSRELVDKALDKLENQKYIDDVSFSKSFINNQIMTTTKGPNKIVGELVNKGVDVNIIGSEIIIFTEELQKERVEKLANKAIKLNRTRGGVVLRNKIINDLINLGYDKKVILDVVNNLSFTNSQEIVDKEYNKLYRKYSRKYTGRELEYKIKQGLYQKGLSYED